MLEPKSGKSLGNRLLTLMRRAALTRSSIYSVAERTRDFKGGIDALLGNSRG